MIGNVKMISDPKTFGEKTELVEVILETGDAKWKEYPKFQFRNMFMKKVEGTSVGDRVVISFGISGRMSEAGDNSYINLNAFGMTKIEEAEPKGKEMSPPPPDDEGFTQNPPPPDEEGLPF